MNNKIRHFFIGILLFLINQIVSRETIHKACNINAIHLYPGKRTSFSLPARQSHKHQDQFVSRETL